MFNSSQEFKSYPKTRRGAARLAHATTRPCAGGAVIDRQKAPDPYCFFVFGPTLAALHGG
jgi:hypothetical protein